MMDIKQRLVHEISKLRQQRQYAERRSEMTGKMLSACLIFRARLKGKRDLQSIKTIGSNIEYKSYGYLTCFYRGRNLYRYIPKNEIDKVAKLTESYRIFCQNMQQVRQLNRRMVELLDKIGELQQEEVKNYVETRTKRIGKEKRGK
jgi:hypothetical protein